MSTRREFLRSAALAAGSLLSSPARTAAGPKAILLRSAWQTVNIGDIAHTPGVLRVLEQHLPETSVILWSGTLDRGVEALLRRRFPKLRIVRDGGYWELAAPRPDDPTLAEAMEEADLMLHGSSASLSAYRDLDRWHRATGKPYGAFGVTLGSPIPSYDSLPHFPEPMRAVLERSAFIFTRETRSLQAAREAGIRIPRLAFVPDGTFALDLRNDAAAASTMKRHGLEPDQFICAVPRLRVTPYWEIRPNTRIAPEELARRKAVNEAHAEADHAKLREVLVTWVRETGRKVLICPEMTYQVDLIRPLVFDPLPADVKAKVVPLERYWLTDEAASVYRHARAVISMECHSPIMANANGRPGFHLRQPTDTWKGQMYPDLGLGEWKFELETATGSEIAERLLNVHSNYEAALARVQAASAKASERFASAVQVLRNVGARR